MFKTGKCFSTAILNYIQSNQNSVKTKTIQWAGWAVWQAKSRHYLSVRFVGLKKGNQKSHILMLPNNVPKLLLQPRLLTSLFHPPFEKALDNSN